MCCILDLGSPTSAASAKKTSSVLNIVYSFNPQNKNLLTVEVLKIFQSFLSFA